MSLGSNFLSELTIVSPLGRGAGSFVYKVTSRKTGASFALKVFDKKQRNFSALKPKILNEVSIHSKLSHENIVQFMDSFEDDDNIYILLELCEGGELYNFIRKTKISLEKIRNFSLQIALALKYLHEQKIMHRDLKLANILLTKEQTIKICDLGLAVQLEAPFFERNTLCGTPNYISPEILNNEPYSEKIDCWSFGCVVYSLACGQAPFEAQTLQETLQKIKTGKMSYPESIDPLLKELLGQVLSMDSKKRISMDDVIKHPFFIEDKEENRRMKHQKSFDSKNSCQSTRNHKNSDFCLSTLGLFSCRGKENLNQVNLFAKGKENNVLDRRRTNTVHIGSQISTTKDFKASAFVKKNVFLRFLNLQKEMTLGKSEFQENLETKRNRAHSQHSACLTPLKVKDLEPCSFNLKRCNFEILKDYTVRLEIANKNIEFRISADGSVIEITNGGFSKKYKLEQLPPKYHKFYLYGKKICEKVRSKTPKIIINNEDGQFFLMKNDPKPNFEAFLKNGYAVYLKAWEDEFKIVKGDLVVNKENYWMWGKEKDVKESLRKAYMYLKACLKRV